MRKKILPMAIMMAVCIVLFSMPAFAADQLTKLDQGGMRILTIVRRIGYWIILIKCIGDLIKSAAHGDMHAVGKIVMTYVLIYGALFFVPWALRLTEGIF